MSAVAGVILGGGRATRMGGGDKALLPLGGTTILGEIIARLRPQIGDLAINANGDPARLDHFGLPILPDAFGTFEGPLAGVLTGLVWAEQRGAHALLTTAGDTPFLPADLVAEMAPSGGKAIIIAASGGHRHPTIALWPVALRADLEHFLVSQPSRRVNDFINRHPHAEMAFAAADGDPFFNINTPDDLVEAQRRMEKRA